MRWCKTENLDITCGICICSVYYTAGLEDGESYL